MESRTPAIEIEAITGGGRLAVAGGFAAPTEPCAGAGVLPLQGIQPPGPNRAIGIRCQSMPVWMKVAKWTRIRRGSPEPARAITMAASAVPEVVSADVSFRPRGSDSGFVDD